MKKLLPILLVLSCFQSNLSAQSYFPPNGFGTWEVTPTEELGWCQENIDSLNSYLDSRHTKGFIILKNGRIAMESYFNGHSATSLWYWASAGKSLVGTLTGIAQEDGILSIEDPVSAYIGEGWTSCSAEDEVQRKIRHQLSMTSTFSNVPFLWDCTEPSCFICNGAPDGEWHYHNGVYKRLHDVLESASGQTMTAYTSQKIGTIIGMGGFWTPDALFYSNTRAMARFGLLALNNFNWNGTTILGDQNYIDAMTNTANPYNLAYGYLWWLNGKENYMLPIDLAVYPGSIIPAAPADLYGGLGANDQRVYVIPSEDMVVVRMGDEAYENVPALSFFDNELWGLISALPCQVTATSERIENRAQLICYPNPNNGNFAIQNKEDYATLRVYDQTGRIVLELDQQAVSESISLPGGIYLLQGTLPSGEIRIAKMVVN